MLEVKSPAKQNKTGFGLFFIKTRLVLDRFLQKNDNDLDKDRDIEKTRLVLDRFYINSTRLVLARFFLKSQVVGRYGGWMGGG